MEAKRKGIIGSVVALGLLLCCLAAYLLLSRGQVYRGVRCRVTYHSDTLVTGADLAAYMNANCPGVRGQLKRNVNLSRIGGIIRRWPYADSVRMTTDMRGVLHVEVVQVQVLLHVFNSQGSSFYLARTGHTGRMVPCVPGRPLRVMVASGAIADTCRPDIALEWGGDTVCRDLMLLASQLERHPFWRAQVSQIYVRKPGDYSLLPTVGNHIVELGGTDNLDRKLDNLWNIYTQGFNVAWWQRYAKVSLQFGDRVPCEKRTI